MKTKYIALALCVGQLGMAAAQETAVKEAPAPAKEAAKLEVPTFKAETPLEKRALKVMDLMTTFPDIFEAIKDEASLGAAKGKIDTLIKNLETEAEAIKKLPVPDNAARKGLEEKMKPLQTYMEKRMQKSMMGMMALPPELGPKVQEVMMSVGPKMMAIGETMEKYFVPDKEAAKEAPAKIKEAPAEKK